MVPFCLSFDGVCACVRLLHTHLLHRSSDASDGLQCHRVVWIGSECGLEIGDGIAVLLERLECLTTAEECLHMAGYQLQGGIAVGANLSRLIQLHVACGAVGIDVGADAVGLLIIALALIDGLSVAVDGLRDLTLLEELRRREKKCTGRRRNRSGEANANARESSICIVLFCSLCPAWCAVWCVVVPRYPRA